MKKLKPFDKKHTGSSFKLTPAEPLELLKSKKHPNEEPHHRKAFLAYMTYRDRELPENECIAETAKLCRVADSTIKKWKSEFGWDDRYNDQVADILLLVAASYQPELRKNAHAIIASLRATRIDIELKTKQYFMQLEEYKEKEKEYLEQPSGLKKKIKMPALPKPPFEVNSLGGLSEYTKILKVFIGDDESKDGPDLKKFSTDEIRKMISIGDVQNLQIIQNQGHDNSSQSFPEDEDDDPIDVQATSS